MKKLYIIKVGGKVIDDEQSLNKFLQQFHGITDKKILIHGGGKIASDMSKNLGIEPQMVNGRRITDEATLKVVTMVYAGLVGKTIVSKLQALKCNVIGLTGADGNLLQAQKRRIKDIDYGYVGDVDKVDVNEELLSNLLEAEITPVIAALTHDGEGSMLNTNADTMASIIAQALVDSYQVHLIYCFEQAGVMKDLEKGVLINVLNQKNTDQYIKDDVIHSGMLPKLHNAFDAKSNGVAEVRIGHFEELTSLIDQKTGTEII